MNFSITRGYVSRFRVPQRGISCAVILSCAALLLSRPEAADALASFTESETDHQVSDELANPYAGFLGKYVDWARSIEAEGQQRGIPLTRNQIELAKEIGIKRPENVRLIFVESVPFPTHDEDMRKAGEALGFIGPGIINNAQAFGYTIWIRNGFTLDRPKLAHELVHVQQIERSGNFAQYAKQYMMELGTYGHNDMPLELEAYQANEKYKCSTFE